VLPGRQLAAALRRAPLVPYQGRLCRAVHAASLYGFQKKQPYVPRPLFDLGSPASGARYTPRGGAPALYLAEDYETSLHEYLQVGAHARLTPTNPTGAIVLFVADVQLTAVLDLADRDTLRLLGTTAAELREPWRYRRDRRTPPTRVLGRAVAADVRIQAIRFPSTKGKGACFAILTDHIIAPAFVRVHDSENHLVAEVP
jgi:RES domain-containing protein